MDARDRGILMSKFADLLEEEADELAALETLDNGKPIRDSRGADIPLVIDCIRYYAGWADKLEYAFPGKKVSSLGVVGQIIPWNFPLLMAAWKIAPGTFSLACVRMSPTLDPACGSLRHMVPNQRPSVIGGRKRRSCIARSICAGRDFCALGRPLTSSRRWPTC